MLRDIWAWASARKAPRRYEPPATAVVVARQLAALQAAATPAEATRAARQAQAVALPEAGAGMAAQRMIRPDGGIDDLAQPAERPQPFAELQGGDQVVGMIRQRICDRGLVSVVTGEMKDVIDIGGKRLEN